MKRVAAILLAAVLVGCADTRADVVPSKGVAEPVVEATFADASTRFSIDLLKEVDRTKPGTNHFLSPASASIILSLVANGAKGETQAAMLQGLRYDGMSLAAINQANQGLQALLANPDPKVELSVANAIWHAKALAVAPSFAATAKAEYQATIRPATFGTPEALAAINGWVKEETRGKIPRLLEETRKDDAMWLVNALYLKGAWSEPFATALTRERPFHLVDGSTKPVSFMHRRDQVQYLAADGVQGIRLPYGKGGLALYAIMPDRWAGFLDGLTAERWQGWLGQMASREVIVGLPKVKLEYQAELIKPLAAMGMGLAFDGNRADFTGLFSTPGSFVIGQVLQKTYLEINEEGTEAAAATAVGVVATSAPVAPPPEVVLDHPFLLAIRDERTGVLLFLGTVLEP